VIAEGEHGVAVATSAATPVLTARVPLAAR
jgi:hypothetical protein